MGHASDGLADRQIDEWQQEPQSACSAFRSHMLVWCPAAGSAGPLPGLMRRSHNQVRRPLLRCHAWRNVVSESAAACSCL
eukprot:scaffold20385_cov121-Isochrysis_galbana.AAC.7